MSNRQKLMYSALVAISLFNYSCSRSPPTENPEITKKIREVLKLARQFYVNPDQAAEIIKKIGPGAALSLGAILKEEDEFGRKFAARMLTYLGPNAEPALPVLICTINDKNYEVCVWAATAIGTIGPAAYHAVPELARAIEDEKRGIGKEALCALMKIGPKAKTALPTLIRALHNSNDDIRLGAACAISAIGPDAREAVTALLS